MKKLLDLVAVVVFGFIMVLLFTGCGTTSIYQCDSDKYLGYEKEACRERVKNMQYQRLSPWERVNTRR